MAENEIAKHTKAVYSILTEPHRGWKHKLTDVLTEVIVIVFAVSVSIWFHNWSEERRDRKEAREFLTGLREDIKGDEEHLKSSERFYENALRGLTYFSKAAGGTAVNSESSRAYTSDIFLSSTYLQPYIGRYEGLKQSGRFKIIENNDLLNNIIILHEQVFVQINSLNEIYNNSNSNYIIPLLGRHVQMDSLGKVTNRQELLHNSEMRLYMNVQKGLITNNIMNAYANGIAKCEELIKQIDGELK